jgi:hypothetical protein
MDEAWLEGLPETVARAVLRRVVDDLKEARDRLNQNSENSSRPPGSRPPWENRRAAEAEEDDGEAVVAGEPPAAVSEPEAVESPAETEIPPARVKQSSGRKPGQQPGAVGHGRRQQLRVHEEVHRHPNVCAACGAPLLAAGPAYTGWDTIDLIPLAPGEAGLKLGVIRQVLHEAGCACGHRTRADHDRTPRGATWHWVSGAGWDRA